MSASAAPRTDQPLRLIDFSVRGLFDEFDYRIPFNTKKHVTAIIAPNGSGKTLCLRFINNFFENKWGIFSETQFQKIVFRFSDRSEVIISKIQTELSLGDNLANMDFVVNILGVGKEPVQWQPRIRDGQRVPPYERYLPFLSRVSSQQWRNDHTGELLSWSDIIDEYGNQLPDVVRRGALGTKPDVLERIIASVDCRLIETQRLLILGGGQDDPPYYGRGRKHRSTLAITQKAEVLKDIISQEIGKYATLSQSLDRSFPRRVIQQLYKPVGLDIRQQLQDLDVKRQKLMSVGILDTEADEPVALPPGELDNNIVRVLSVYADDTRRKLASLSAILAKITLFKSLIDQRFVTKDVQINRSHGIDVYSHNKKIPLDKLSSGEQHQLVLFFEMLFETKDNALILIDEPELSLHVAWQKKFISDLLKIIELNKFDVVLATHSPQLIGKWNDLVVELGDVDADPDDESQDRKRWS